jgi:predicted ester cyclase
VTDIREQARQFYQAVDAQNWERLRDIVAPEWTERLGGFDRWCEFLQTFYVAFPGARHIIDDFVVEGDRVATRCRFEGIHGGPFRGVSPTGKAVSARVMHFDRFAAAKLVEHFGVFDMLGLLEQIGAPYSR